MSQKTNNELRLGNMLLKRGVINRSQLTLALHHQRINSCKLGVALLNLKLATKSQIDQVLKRQKALRTLAGSLALTCGTFGTVAAEIPNNQYPSQHSKLSDTSRFRETPISTMKLDELSKTFYFSGTKKHLFSISTDLSSKTGIEFSLLNSQESLFDSLYTYDFEPQISLFSSSSKPSKPRFSTKKIGPGLDRAYNTIPVTFMLTLKGRCLYENSGNTTTMWSLDSAKKGVQRKAMLMFSITKHF